MDSPRQGESWPARPSPPPLDWTEVHERIAKRAHNSMMADAWDDLPPNGVERAAWRKVAAAVIAEVQVMLKERSV